MGIQAQVLGIGEVIPPKDHGSSALDLMIRAARAAIADAKVDRAAIDGLVVTARATLPNLMHPSEGSPYLAEYLGISPCMHRTIAYGAISSLGAVTEAMMMLDAGFANYVLVVSGDTPRREKGLHEVATLYASAMREVYEQPFGPTTIAAYALSATRYMGLYSCTAEDLAAVPVASRRHAQRNPDALFRGDLSVEDVLASDIISSPLHLLECATITDGAAAVLLSRAGSSARTNRRSVRLTADKEILTYQSISLQDDLLDIGCSKIVDGVLNSAGIERADTDLIYLYDSLSIHPILQLEALGYCARGEGASFAASGALDPGGQLPMNTHGGLMSCVNPGITASLFFVTEATQQLRGEAGERQVSDVEVAVMSATGGFQSWYQVLVAQVG